MAVYLALLGCNYYCVNACYLKVVAPHFSCRKHVSKEQFALPRKAAPGSRRRSRKYAKFPAAQYLSVPLCQNVVSCTLHKCATTYLKNNEKYVKLTKKNGLKLVATSTQQGAITSNLEIWKWNNNIAFCFKYTKREIYLVTENKNRLELKRLPQTSDNDIREEIQRCNSWFQMVDVGTHSYCIRAANSAKYLKIDQNTPHVTLSQDDPSDMQALDRTSHVSLSVQ
ncbi:hypothetical protein WMY93_004431 [Mugilogobius chulae]|uniref:Uncharacterized protein n=1 Tax=Mugilogobius chulae TaxID=88201 RepID=A0AAW0PNI6_9GOBI